VPAPGVGTPFCVEEAGHLSRSASPSTGKRYGLQRVCRIFGLARSTAYYLRAREAIPPDLRPSPKRRGPIGAGTDEELVGHIRRVLAESRSTARATARSGPGCGIRASAPPPSGSGG
jgi:hypothetical protein